MPLSYLSERNMDMSDEQVTAIGLMPDWGAGPLWVTFGDDVAAPYNAEEISEVAQLSDALRDGIAAWDDRYQSTYNDEVPQESGILDPAEQAAFIADGWELARKLRAEVSAEIVIRYAPLDTGAWETVQEVE